MKIRVIPDIDGWYRSAEAPWAHGTRDFLALNIEQHPKFGFAPGVKARRIHMLGLHEAKATRCLLLYEFPGNALDQPTVHYVETDPKYYSNGFATCLFQHFRRIVRQRPITALAASPEGEAAMRTWGFVQDADGWWYLKRR